MISMAPLRGCNFTVEKYNFVQGALDINLHVFPGTYLGKGTNKEFPVIFMDNIASFSHVSAFSLLFCCKNKGQKKVNLQVVLSSNLQEVRIRYEMEEAILFWGSLYAGILEATLDKFFLEVTSFVSQHRKWPLELSAIFSWRRWNCERTGTRGVGWFAWLEISWRIWRNQKSWQELQLSFLDSVCATLLSYRLNFLRRPSSRSSIDDHRFSLHFTFAFSTTTLANIFFSADAFFLLFLDCEGVWLCQVLRCSSNKPC